METEQTREATVTDRRTLQAYFIGGGIAALAGAAFLIRDGHMPGANIHILEELKISGGGLDGVGSPETGYVIRGGRMLNDETYECTWDLLKTIPSLQDPDRSVRDEIVAFNRKIRTRARARLVDGNGAIVDVSSMGFSNQDRLELAKLMAVPEDSLGPARINQWFGPAFFTTNFWYMWATTFAFQPWHSLIEFKRYLHRFIHEFPRIHTLAGVRRTPYNQYDSLVLPLLKWLKAHGVRLEMSTRVEDLDFKPSKTEYTVTRLHCTRDGERREIAIHPGDLVFVTNGSMVEGSSLGSMSAPPRPDGKGSSWRLWENIANKQPGLGDPGVFADHIPESLWESFTVTCHDPAFFQLMEDFSGNPPGTGALVTFKESNWLMSIVLAYQPHFINQPEDVRVFWGYGLFPNEPGNFVQKKMTECSGAEILTELCSQLRFTAQLPLILKTANCIPCLMPFITSQFLARSRQDRPPVVPPGSTNLAFIGQFCEIPDDVVFTVEYSVRSAQTAVYTLLGLDKEIPPIYPGQFDVRVLFDSFIAMFR